MSSAYPSRRQGQFSWYELITTDAEAAKTFYKNVMGWGILNPSIPQARYSLFTAGTVLVGGLVDMPGNTPRPRMEAAWIGYIGVDDVDATAKLIERLGGAVHVIPRDVVNVSRYSIFADPQKARLGLLKWAKPMQQKPATIASTGRVGWHELLAEDSKNAWTFYSEVFGWQSTSAQFGEMGTYQLFSARGQTMGGIVTKASAVPCSCWLYYFNVEDIRSAAERVKAAGGQIFNGPVDLPSGNSMIQCKDPQGAVFALRSKRAHSALGYFKDADGHQWSW
jgi:predicted enzyme related to lactoylglutathione lyase